MLGEGERPEIRVIHLSTGEIRVLGPGGAVVFLDDDHVYLYDHETDTSAVINIHTSQPVEGPEADELRALGYLDYALESEPLGEHLIRATVIERATGEAVMAFNAYPPYGIAVTPEGHLAVYTPPVDGHVNLFVIDIPAGTAEFVATVAVPGPVDPLLVTPGHVVWTQDFCEAGPTWIFDRGSGALTRLTDRIWPVPAPSGLLASIQGPWRGPPLQLTGFIDPDTLEYILVAPSLSWSWTDDARFVSVGRGPGKGGGPYC